MLRNANKKLLHTAKCTSTFKQIYAPSLRLVHSNAETVDLHCVKLEKQDKESQKLPLVVIHGLLGNTMNFSSFARHPKINAERDVYLVDLRNHGRSPHHPDGTFEAMASDVHEFFNKAELDQCDVLGFSLGGKVSMTLALMQPDSEKRIRRLIVGDIAPVKYVKWDIPTVLEAMRKIDLKNLKQRYEADKQLMADIPDVNVRGFVLTNLIRQSEDGPFQWKCNLEALYNNLSNMADFPFDSFNLQQPYNNPVLFIKGGRSKLIQDKDLPTINHLFPNNEIVVFEKSEHWVHFTEPQRFADTVSDFLEKV